MYTNQRLFVLPKRSIWWLDHDMANSCAVLEYSNIESLHPTFYNDYQWHQLSVIHLQSCPFVVHYVQESSDFYVLATPAPCMGLGQPLTTSLGLVSCLGHATSCPVRHFCHQVEGFYSACCPGKCGGSLVFLKMNKMIRIKIPFHFLTTCPCNSKKFVT